MIDASEALDGSKRSIYDPDELDEEQRERRLRKTLNEAFKTFCKSLERVAKVDRSIDRSARRGGGVDRAWVVVGFARQEKNKNARARVCVRAPQPTSSTNNGARRASGTR